ncbi:MAG: Hsp20 family protein [Salinivirgaceae bacterium]|jgi:HSP20 family protein|nr:Hsp20 family protein [Salinivirgaceae bacterium]
MTLVRFNKPNLINSLANEAFFGNSFDSNLGTHSDCSTDNVEYKISNEDAIVNIEFAIPGLSKADIEIELNDEILSVKTKERDENDSRTGFAAKEFEKRFKISDIINQDEISAHSENGVLYISLPKVDVAVKKPARSIEIV